MTQTIDKSAGEAASPNMAAPDAAPKHIRIEEFDYPLPDERIAKHPLEQRDACKLLVRSHDGTISAHRFTELPDLLPEDAMLVYNNTRVINARLRFRKDSGVEGRQGALIEIFCLEPEAPADYAQNFAAEGECSWTCFVGNSKRWKEGSLALVVEVDGQTVMLKAERVERRGNASIVRFTWETPGVTFSKIIGAAGEIPIPPYLNRSTEQSDSKDYQTVYSRIEGSVAAPTAGLHFTPEVLARVSEKGIPRRELTLHVGAGTFQPVKSDEIGDHPMHAEFIAVSIDLLRELRDTSRRVIAVGTTSVRTLESLYHAGRLMMAGRWDGEVPQWCPYEEAEWPGVAEALDAIVRHLEAEGATTFIATTRIIIAPGYTYRVVRGMVTNFHQPKSTLLLLVSAFTGGDWRRLYAYALASECRFLSYGDACLLL